MHHWLCNLLSMSIPNAVRVSTCRLGYSYPHM
jgi:hypothetical protein